MEKLMISLLVTSASMSLVVLVLRVAMPALRRRFRSRHLYLLWLLVAVCFLIPYRPALDLPFFENTTVWESAAIPESPADTGPAYVAPSIPRALLESSDSRDAMKVQEMLRNHAASQQKPEIVEREERRPASLPALAALWLVGVCLSLLYRVYRQWRFTRKLDEWKEELPPDVPLRLQLRALAQDRGIRQRVSLQICPLLPSPLSMGFFRPCILLPCSDYTPEEAHLLLAHELQHIKNRDIIGKLLIQLCSVLHWFNPAVYLLQREADMQCELACDQQVNQSLDPQQRKQYASLILHCAAMKPAAPLSTAFSGGKQALRARIQALFDAKKRKGNGAALLSIVLALGLFTGCMGASNPSVRDAMESVDTPNQQDEPGNAPIDDVVSGASLEALYDPYPAPIEGPIHTQDSALLAAQENYLNWLPNQGFVDAFMAQIDEGLENMVVQGEKPSREGLLEEELAALVSLQLYSTDSPETLQAFYTQKAEEMGLQYPTTEEIVVPSVLQGFVDASKTWTLKGRSAAGRDVVINVEPISDADWGSQGSQSEVYIYIDKGWPEVKITQEDTDLINLYLRPHGRPSILGAPSRKEESEASSSEETIYHDQLTKYAPPESPTSVTYKDGDSISGSYCAYYSFLTEEEALSHYRELLQDSPNFSEHSTTIYEVHSGEVQRQALVMEAQLPDDPDKAIVISVSKPLPMGPINLESFSFGAEYLPEENVLNCSRTHNQKRELAVIEHESLIVVETREYGDGQLRRPPTP